MKKLIVAALVALPLAVSAQTTIKVGGVEVNTNGTSTKVKTPGTEVETDGEGSEVKTKKTKVRVKSKDEGDDEDGKPLAAKVKFAKHKTITCDDDQELVLSNVLVEGKITVKATQNCTVTIKGGVFNASKTTIDAAGNATVNLEGCTLNGPVSVAASGNATVNLSATVANGAIKLSGNSTLVAASSTFNGKVQVSGNGQLQDDGGNVFNVAR